MTVTTAERIAIRNLADWHTHLLQQLEHGYECETLAMGVEIHLSDLRVIAELHRRVDQETA